MIFILFTLIIVLSLGGYVCGRQKARKMIISLDRAGSHDTSLETDKVHSLPFYYGAYVALMVFIPAISLFVLSLIIAPYFYEHQVTSTYADHLKDLSVPQYEVFLRDVRGLADGNIASRSTPQRIAAAELYKTIKSISDKLICAVIIGISLLSGYFAFKKIVPRFRARNRVEKIIRAVMILSAMLAILTTIGIVFIAHF